jgi:hypothetical protein
VYGLKLRNFGLIFNKFISNQDTKGGKNEEIYGFYFSGYRFSNLLREGRKKDFPRNAKTQTYRSENGKKYYQLRYLARRPESPGNAGERGCRVLRQGKGEIFQDENKTQKRRQEK